MFDGSLIISKETGQIALGADYTIDITDETATSAEIQAEIDGVPIDFGGHDVYLDFADNNYDDLTAELVFNNFRNGRLFIRGNTGESGLHTNQAVILDFSGGTSNCMQFYNCSCQISLDNIKFVKADVAGYFIDFSYCDKRITINGLFTTQSANANDSECFVFHVCPCVLIQKCYADDHYSWAVVTSSKVTSIDNDTSGTACQYGFSITACGDVGLAGANQVSWVTAQAYEYSGGTLRS